MMVRRKGQKGRLRRVWLSGFVSSVNSSQCLAAQVGTIEILCCAQNDTVGDVLPIIELAVSKGLLFDERFAHFL